MCEIDDLVTTERVAVVVQLLVLGRRMTTREVAAVAGINPSSAYHMLGKIGRVLPIAFDDGIWAYVTRDDL